MGKQPVLKRPDQLIHDNFADGSILKIEKAFNVRGDRWYSFAAIKAKGLWYVTGPSAPHAGMDTEEFILWMTRGSRLMPMPKLYWAKVVYEI